MTKEKDATRARIETIKTELQSVSTCTAITVTGLQDLLAGKTETAQKENIRVKGTQASSDQSSTHRRPGTATATRPEAVAARTALLSPRERYILATEAVNVTLKSLADALKAQPTPPKLKPPPNAATNAQKPQRPRLGHSKSSSVSQYPLKERSLGQINNSPTKPTFLRRSSSYSTFLTTGPDPGLVAVAECARLAFAYLSTSEAVKVAGKESPELQLENGLLALVGKLVAHGLDNLAIKEMRILKRRLDRYLGFKVEKEDNGPTTNRRTPQQPPPPEKENLASLLDYGDIDVKSAAIPIIINLQIYALRVVARVKRPRIVEAAWSYLQLSHPSSPANLIWRVAKTTDHRAKVARQLESLAQTILLLCPSISSSADEEQLQPSPDVVLCLQHLAFRVRQRWWTIAQHQCDKEKELEEPFSKCLVAFARRSTLPAVKKFRLAESLYTDLLGTESSPKDGAQLSVSTSKTLGSLARAAELPDEALRWLGMSPLSGVEESTAATAARSIRIAAVSLEACLKDGPTSKLGDTISVALEALSGSLDGSAKELEALLLEVNALRRAATRLLPSNSSSATRSSISALQQDCVRVVAASVHFTSRFIDICPLDDAPPKVLAQHHERVSMAFKLARSIVDSVVACCRQTLTSESAWIELDTLIKGCVNLISQFEGEHMDKAASGSLFEEAAHSPYVKISNAYWALHLQLRKLDAKLVSVSTAMQRSTELLQSRSQAERECGLLTTKLDRLGETLDQLELVQESRIAFAQCIQVSLDDGVAQEIAEAASKHTIAYTFGNGRSLTNLGRTLKSYHRSFIKHGLQHADEPAFFDDLKHAVAVRGALLEWQLTLYQKTLSRNRQWNSALNSSIQTMVDRLLGLYIPSQFPIRCQRLYLRGLQLSQAHSGIISDISMLENVDKTLNKTEDRNLARFADHLRSLRTLQSCLQEAGPSNEALRDCFVVWQSMLDSAASWDELAGRIDDVDHWLETIQASVDFLSAKGEDYEVLPVLHLSVRILELQASPDSSRLLMALCTLGLHFLRLGYSGKAGLVFTKAELLLTNKTVSTEAQLRWHLGYAEYLLNIGNANRCESTLSAAEILARSDTKFMELANPSTTSSGRTLFNRVVADACYVSSLLSSSKGDYKNAARYARRCVILNRRIWAALESKANSRKAAAPESSSEMSDTPAFDPLSSSRNDKGTPLAISITHDALKGPDFWPLVPSLYRALMQHSNVYVSQGLLHEAVYVAEQAEKVASAIGSRTLQVDNTSRVAELWIQSGRPDKAQSLLDSLGQFQCGKHLSTVAYRLSVARMHHASHQFEDEMAVYDTLEKLLYDLSSPSCFASMESFTSSVDALAKDVSALSLEGPRPGGSKSTRNLKNRSTAMKTEPKTVAKSTSRTTRNAPLKSAPTAVPRARKKAVASQVAEEHSISEQCSSLCTFQADIAYRRVITYLLQEDVAKATDCLNKTETLIQDRNGSHAWVRFKAMLAQAIKSISQDFTFNTLPESTIAFPSVPTQDRQSSEGVVTKRPVARSTAKNPRGKKQAKEDFVELLQNAREKLAEAHTYANAGSNHVFRQVSAALSQATVLLSAVSRGRMRGSLHPLYSAYMSEIPKYNALMLAQAAVEVEQETMSREVYTQWPKTSLDRTPLASLVDFQKDYIDILPETWTAVSLALSEEQDEIYITRYERGASPFVIRLPLARHSSRDLDEEEFSFVDGKREFEDIIELSDFSTRSAKDMTSREARVQWWTEREALDTKLRELLLNIENIWLGGFKGIFSDHASQPALLARFRKSFDNILNRHLPSRRKKGQQKKASLDPRVLELFIGLGDASNEELEFDDALTDLIYFVVDILQFNGEPNAYDEIDFDAMAIETLDALRAYHNAAKSASQGAAHTILILDKDLHMLPWESLPCLERLSISRLPSLAALRERLLAARPSSVTQNAHAGHYISAQAGGTSILNPSGDLSHTLKTIQPRLDDMQGNWTHIINRAPSEKEFEGSLKDNELVLYFGHGSGAQFVRSKSVRRLYLNAQEKGKAGCATTFLFGCSSVHLSDNGIYEPSGMLASYLTAGAPAVVGMLWDVTDKDCDRFAVKAGEIWGLWPETKDEASVEPPPTVKKAKGKGKVARLVDEVETPRAGGNARKGRKNKAVDGANDIDLERERRRGVGLDEAVRDARQACVMRYLNGAAAVVYGIPVYLE